MRKHLLHGILLYVYANHAWLHLPIFQNLFQPITRSRRRMVQVPYQETILLPCYLSDNSPQLFYNLTIQCNRLGNCKISQTQEKYEA